MENIRRLGSLIVRLSAAARACTTDGKEIRGGKPPSDFLRPETVAELEALAPADGTESIATLAMGVVRNLRSQDWNVVPDFNALRSALHDLKSVAKADQRVLIEVAYAAAGMSIVNAKAQNEMLLPRLEAREADLVGTGERMGWIVKSTLSCNKLNKALGRGEFQLIDLAGRSFVELCGIHKSLLDELFKLEALDRERKAAEARKAAQQQRKPDAPRPAQKPRPNLKLSGF